MLKLLEFIFQDGIHFFGILIFIFVVIAGIVRIINAFKGAEIYNQNNNQNNNQNEE